MIPVWLPWTLVGGVIFIVLSFIGAKYKDKQYKSIQCIQDFISGSIFIAFAGILMPDMFPAVELPSFDTHVSNEFDLQIGPPRLIGR
jgi:uncharacterized membrane protein